MKWILFEFSDVENLITNDENKNNHVTFQNVFNRSKTGVRKKRLAFSRGSDFLTTDDNLFETPIEGIFMADLPRLVRKRTFYAY